MNIKNYIDTEELKFTVEFITPCFLGGATGNAEIRTAPFKNLIRRWWRIVNGNLSPEELWQKEAELFGSTERNPKLGKSFGKSKVLLKILAVSEKCIPTNEKFSIGDLETGYGTMSLAKYIGYGPVETKSYLPPKSKISFSLKNLSVGNYTMTLSTNGLFESGEYDMRDEEIWNQLNWYLKWISLRVLMMN